MRVGIMFEKRNRKKRLYKPHAFPLDKTTFFTPSTLNNRVLTRIITNNSKPPPFLDKTFWKTKNRVLKKMSSCFFTMGSKLWAKNVLKEIIYNVVR